MPVANYQEWQEKCQLAHAKGAYSYGTGNGSYAASSQSFLSLYSTIQKNSSSSDVPDNPGVCDHNSTGALLRTPPLPGSADGKLLLAELEYGYGHTNTASSSPRTLALLYDRLYHTGGLVGNVATEQMVSMPTPAMNRYTDGEGVQIWLEVYSSIGSSGGTAVVKYTNTKGVPKVSPPTAFAIAGISGQGHTVPVPLAPGDTGVLSVQSVTLSAAGTTAGNFGVVLVKPLALTPMDSTAQVERNAYRNMLQGAGIVEILPNACLALMQQNPGMSSTTGRSLVGRVGIIEA